MTAITVGGYSKGAFSVMACATGTPLFHGRHSHTFFLGRDDFAGMAAFAGPACLSHMKRMAENGGAKPFDRVSYIFRRSFMAADAVFFTGDAEGFDAGMTGTAGLGFLHLSHGKTFTVFQAENGIMADFTVIVVLAQMEVMVKNDRGSILEVEGDILGFSCPDGQCRQQK